MSRFLLVDTNALGYAAHNTSILKSPDGVEVQAVYNTLKMIKSQIDKSPKYNRIIFLWDTRAEFRYELFPEYKGKRDDTVEKAESRAAYKDLVPTIKSMIAALGGCQLQADGYEADDIAGYLSRLLVKQGHTVKLVTGDGDWKQLINGRVSWTDPRKAGRDCNRITFHENTGYATARQFLEAKALEGDSSDNIPGVQGIGKKTAELIMREYGSVRELAIAKVKLGEFTKENISPDLSRARGKINKFISKEGIDIFNRNIKLMDLLDETRDADIQSLLEYNNPKKDMELFFDYCDDLSFQSFLRNQNTWKTLL